MRKAIAASPLLALVVLAGCSGGQLQPTEQLELCQSNSASLSSRLKENETARTSAESARTELEGRIADVESKLTSAQEQVDSLGKSNKDLSAAILAGKGEQAGKIKDLVGEKDLLGQRLAALQKEKITLERAKTNLQAKLGQAGAARDKLTGELTAARAQGLTLQGQVEAFQGQADQLKAAEETAASARRARLNKTHEDMGTLADAVLKEMQAEKAKLAQDGETIVLTLQEPVLFEPLQAKLTEGGAPSWTA